MQKQEGNLVKVAVRIRPSESEREVSSFARTNDNELEMESRKDAGKLLSFKFAKIFGEAADQLAVFEYVRPYLEFAFSVGENVSIFAYGPTGTGKTFTMMGPAENPGLICRAVEFLTAKIAVKSAISLSFSFLEIYQEKIIDLLDPSKRSEELKVREGKSKDFFVDGLTSKPINSAAEFLQMYNAALEHCHRGATNLNVDSSRSHSILQIEIHHPEGGTWKSAKVSLVDLAGSENQKETGNVGVRLEESKNINASLFTLGKVVDALKRHQPSIPYRESKLTMLLRDSLGGTANALFICTVRPELQFYADTLNCLNFGDRSKRVVNRPFQPTSSASLKRFSSSVTNLSAGVGSIRAERRSLQPLSISASLPNVSEADESEADKSEEVVVEGEGDENSFERRVGAMTDTSANDIASQDLAATSAGCSSTNTKPAFDGSQLAGFMSPLLRKFDERVAKVVSAKMKKHRQHIVSELKDSFMGQTFTTAAKNNQTLLTSFRQPVAKADNATPVLFEDDELDVDFYPPTVKKQRLPTKPTASLNQTDANQSVTGRGKSFSARADFDATTAHVETPTFTRDDIGASDGTPGLGKIERTVGGQWTLKLKANAAEKHDEALLVCLNGTAKQIKSLASIGQSRCEKIIAYRDIHGPFTKVDDLRLVEGLSKNFFDQFRKANLVSKMTM